MKIVLKHGNFLYDDNTLNKVNWIKQLRNDSGLCTPGAEVIGLRTAKNIADLLDDLMEEGDPVEKVHVVNTNDYPNIYWTEVLDLIHSGQSNLISIFKEVEKPVKTKPQHMTGRPLTKSILGGVVKQLVNNKDYEVAQAVLKIILDLEK